MWLRPLAALATSYLLLAAAAHAKVVINEIDYDQPGSDDAEFVELLNLGPGAADLGNYALELVNGIAGGAALYQSISLSGVLLEGDTFVVCGNSGLVPSCDLAVATPANLIQNGAPDAIGLRRIDLGVLEDSVSYEGDTGAPYTEGSGVSPATSDTDFTAGVGISRTPDGLDTDLNSTDFILRAITPGFPGGVPPKVVINEIDYDQPGTDTAEFIELLNLGSVPVILDDYVLELVNGISGGATIYQSINLAGVLPAGDTYVVCGNPGLVPNCDLDVAPDTNLIQNGAPDAIGLRRLGELEDAVSYEGNSGAPYTEGMGVSAAASDTDTVPGVGISRTPDGQDTDVNGADFMLRAVTPGIPEAAPPTVPVASPLFLWLAAALLAASARRSVIGSDPERCRRRRGSELREGEVP